MKISPLICLFTFVIALSASAMETADRDWLNMPERASSARELAGAFDAAGVGSFHSERLLQDDSRYVLLLWKNLYRGSNMDVVYGYYYDGSSWVKFYQDSVPMWKGAPRIERRARVLELAEGAVLLLANDTRAVSLGGVPRARTAPTE